jgi:hypothetical protein
MNNENMDENTSSDYLDFRPDEYNNITTIRIKPKGASIGYTPAHKKLDGINRTQHKIPKTWNIQCSADLESYRPSDFNDRTECMCPLYKNIPFKTISDFAIIWDLDETLIHSYSEQKDIKKFQHNLIDPNSPYKKDIYTLSLTDYDNESRGTGDRFPMKGVIRPYAKEILAWCFSYFKVVGVWTAGIHLYGHEVVNILFNEICVPDIIYTREECVTNDVMHHGKPLSKLYKSLEFGKSLNEKNTFIIDDNDRSFNHRNPNNAIEIPAFDPKIKIHNNMLKFVDKNNMIYDDDCLIKLKKWFESNKVINSKDIRTLDKNIF